MESMGKVWKVKFFCLGNFLESFVDSPTPFLVVKNKLLGFWTS